MKNFLLVGILLFLCVVGVVLVPDAKDITKLKQTQMSLSAQLQALQEEQQRLEKKAAEGDTLSLAAQKIPAILNQPEIIRDMLTLEKSTGFAFDGLSFTSGFHSEVQAPVMKISFSTSGAKQNLVQFLKTIENYKRFYGMETLGLSYSMDEGYEQVSFSVNLYTFAQRES